MIVRIESGSAKGAWGTVMTVCWLLDLPTHPELIDPARRATLLAGTANMHRARAKQELYDDL